MSCWRPAAHPSTASHRPRCSDRRRPPDPRHPQPLIHRLSVSSWLPECGRPMSPQAAPLSQALTVHAPGTLPGSLLGLLLETAPPPSTRPCSSSQACLLQVISEMPSGVQLSAGRRGPGGRPCPWPACPVATYPQAGPARWGASVCSRTSDGTVWPSPSRTWWPPWLQTAASLPFVKSRVRR